MQETAVQAGDVVWIRGRRWRITSARRDRRVTRLDVTNHERRLTVLHPFDRVDASAQSERPQRVRPQQALARLAHTAGRAFGLRTLASAIDADAVILPHQLEPALAILHGQRRVLIADDVGLGKTIQAGLVAAEAIRRDPASRLLLIVPASLVPQWASELRNRFGIEASIADRNGLDARARAGGFGESPWRIAGTWIASLDFLKQPHVLEGMPAAPWDLVVIDEAHAACGRSDRHVVADRLARRARRVVLLTATPHSGDEERFDRLIRIGRLDDGDQLAIFRRTRADLGLTSRRRVAWHGVALSDAERRVLAALTTFERVVLRAAGTTGRDAARLLLAVFRKRALSTMSALARSIDRRIAWLDSNSVTETDVWAQPQLDFGGDVDEDIASVEDTEGLRARTGLSGDAERSWLRRLAHLSSVASRVESKVARVVGLLCRVSEPVVVFTEFRHSLELLAGRLRLVRPLSILHGGLSGAERAGALSAFETGSASALLATDVAGQGLNLQARCRWVVSLELPWNPARLEQRIGRVDRIGQQLPVHLTLMVARHQTEADMVAHLARRVIAARRPLGRSALIDVPPSEDAIRRAAIDRTPITPPSVPALTICRAWIRTGITAARQLNRQRTLAERWRGPDQAGRPAWSILRRLPSIAALASGESLLVFAVPLCDGTGALVARHLIAVRGSDSENTRRVVVAAVKGRALRAARLARVIADTGIALDRKLIAAALARVEPFDTQPGLFDGRGMRAFEVARVTSADLARDLEDAIARAHERAKIEAGRPALLVVLTGLSS